MEDEMVTTGKGLCISRGFNESLQKEMAAKLQEERREASKECQKIAIDCFRQVTELGDDKFYKLAAQDAVKMEAFVRQGMKWSLLKKLPYYAVILAAIAAAPVFFWYEGSLWTGLGWFGWVMFSGMFSYLIGGVTVGIATVIKGGPGSLLLSELRYLKLRRKIGDNPLDPKFIEQKTE